MEKKPYKAKKVRLDKKASLFVYAVTLIGAVAARTYQLKTNMNFSTGKYIDDSLPRNYTFMIIAAGLVLILLTLILGKSKDKAIKSCILINPWRLKAAKLNKKISPMAGAAMFLTAGFIIFDMITELSAVVKKNAAISTEDNPVFVLAGISVYKWLIYLLSVISIITFISSGVNILKGEGLSKGNCVFLMFFPIQKLLDMFSTFSGNQLVGVYSEKAYILLTAMTSSMFIIYAARLFAGFEEKRTRFCMCFYGYAASILAATSVVPRYVMYFALDYLSREGMTAPKTADVAMIFMPVLLVMVLWSTYVYRVMPKLNLNGNRRWKTKVTDEKPVSSSDGNKYEMDFIDIKTDDFN